MTATTHILGHRRLLWAACGVTVAGAVVAGTVTGIGSPVAAAIGVLVALGTVGWALWLTAPDREQAKSNLGTGLLVSIIVAAAIGGAQFAIDDRRRSMEQLQEHMARQTADRQNLRMTVGLQQSLVGIDLSGRDLTRFYLAGKDLAQARFDRATLVEANLERARLDEAELSGANLRRATLFEAQLRQANLSGADLGGAEAAGAQLSTADLRGARLRATKLQAARLVGAFLDRADLRGADLRGADVRGAQLRGADLRGANLIRADLRGAQLRGADLRGVKLEGAIVDSRTRWPVGFDPGSA